MRLVIGMLGILGMFWIAVHAANWEKLNPGSLEVILNVYMIDENTAVAVGSNGGIMKTIDGGLTWYPIPINATEFLFDVEFVNQQLGFIAGDYLILRTKDGGETWETLMASTESYLGIFFLDADNGWIVGSNNSVLRTTDGGDNWDLYFAVSTYSLSLHDVFFINPDVGIAVGGDESIFRTENGGQNWQVISGGSSGFGDAYKSVFFNQDSLGWIAGPDGQVLHSTDGGFYWAPIPDLADSLLEYRYIHEVHFPTASTGYLIGNGGIFAKTVDGGKSWTVKKIPGAENSFLYSLHFANANVGMVVGYGGEIYKTSDGGLSWQKLSTAFTTEDIIDLAVKDSQTVWIVTRTGKIFRTTSRGQNWVLQMQENNNMPRAVDFVDTLGWAVGLNGAVYHTRNGGVTWLPQASGTTKNLMDVDFVDDQVGWAVGEDYTLLRTTDGGQTWQRITFSATESGNWYGLYTFDSLRVVICGDGWVSQTMDGGVSWSGMRKSYLSFYDVTFVDSLTGWAACGNGNVFYTNDGGQSWTEQNTNQSNTLYGIHFLDRSTGWAVGIQGTVLETLDGGATWSKDQSKTAIALNDIFFLDKNHGWAVGDGGVVLRGKLDPLTGMAPEAQPNQTALGYELYPNYPNPFNPTTIISFRLPRSDWVRLQIYNPRGQLVREIWRGRLPAGRHSFQWDGRDQSGRRVSSGLYLYQLTAGSRSLTRKMLLLK